MERDLGWVELSATLLRSRQLIRQLSQFITPDLVQDRNLWEVLQAGFDFVRDFGTVPRESDLKVKLDVNKELMPTLSKIFSCELMTEEHAQQQILERVKKLRLWNIVKSTAEDMDYNRVNYSKVYKDVRSLVLDLESVLKEVVLPRDIELALSMALDHAQVERIPTGIRGVDRLLGGGLGRGEISFLIAPPGRGKTANLINIFYSALASFKNALFVSLEMNVESILERFFRRATLQLRKEIIEDRVKTKAMLHGWLGATGSQAFLVYQKRDSFSVQDLEFLIDRIKLSYGVELQVVVIDHMQRMHMSGKGDPRLRIRDTVEDLRALGQDRKIGLHTGSQMNRGAVQSDNPDESHIAEGFSQVESADVVMMFSQSDEEVQAGEGHYTVLKIRDGPGRGMRVPVAVNLDVMLVSDDPQVTGRESGSGGTEGVEGVTYT